MIWVIVGVTGEWSDRRQWTAGYCYTEQHARMIVRMYSALAREIDAYDFEDDDDARQAAMDAHPDPHFDIDYTGTRYHFEAVNMIEETK